MRFYLILLCFVLVSASVFASSELGSLPLTPERRICPIEGESDFTFLKQEFEVFEEGAFSDSNIGLQIIPAIKALLEKNRIEKISLPRPTELSTAP